MSLLVVHLVSQDLSVAGKRAGLAGERSGLYMEQMRCVKELRKADERRGRTAQSIRPRYMVWENVPGAFSSNGGEDFRAVLEEAAKIADETAVIPRPSGKWSNSGAVMGDGWSLAWRVHDAQFWGVPQRRRRISLVCDFGGQSAPEILFERKGVSWNPQESGAQRGEAAGETGGGVASTITATYGTKWNGNAGAYSGGNFVIEHNAAGASRTAVAYSFDSLASNSMKSKNPNSGCRQVEVAKTLDCFDPNPSKNQGGIAVVQKVYDAMWPYTVLPFDTTQITSPQNGNHPHYGDPCHPLAAGAHPPAVAIGNGQLNQISMAEQANTLDTMRDQQAVMVPDVAHTLKAKANCDFRADSETYPVQNSVVRRLTPMECERLQGYPDGWTDIGEWVDSKGKKHKPADSPRYKALGNSIALPFWFWLLRRISAQYYGPATLGSLFDGIGGFPFCWERCNGPGTALWASEIEEFPMAVTKLRFPETT